MDIDRQNVNNSSAVSNQANIQNLDGDVFFSGRSRLAQKFKQLKEDVANQAYFAGFLNDFKHYNTTLDGVGMPKKLTDAGFSDRDIANATARKHQYAKKLEEFRLYKTAQAIDLELFAIICNNFETYVEPLIDADAGISKIKECIREKIVGPIYEMLNTDGQDDTLLDYNMNHIYGMIYFLTGKCHLNWINYDSVQPSV